MRKEYSEIDGGASFPIPEVMLTEQQRLAASLAERIAKVAYDHDIFLVGALIVPGDEHGICVPFWHGLESHPVVQCAIESLVSLLFSLSAHALEPERHREGAMALYRKLGAALSDRLSITTEEINQWWQVE